MRQWFMRELNCPLCREEYSYEKVSMFEREMDIDLN
jgi:hypothetical protein